MRVQVLGACRLLIRTRRATRSRISPDASGSGTAKFSHRYVTNEPTTTGVTAAAIR